MCRARVRGPLEVECIVVRMLCGWCAVLCGLGVSATDFSSFSSKSGRFGRSSCADVVRVLCGVVRVSARPLPQRARGAGRGVVLVLLCFVCCILFHCLMSSINV